MATRNFVPRDDGEGSIGTAQKQWGDIQAKEAHIGNRNITADGNKLDTHETAIDTLQTKVTTLEHAYAGAKAAATVADMTNYNQIYVYVGSETGYTNGNWYYWNDTAWTSGGVYQATALETDKTLTISGAAADSATVGKYIDNTTIGYGSVEIVSEQYIHNGYISATTGEFVNNDKYRYYSFPLTVGTIFAFYTTAVSANYDLQFYIRKSDGTTIMGNRESIDIANKIDFPYNNIFAFRVPSGVTRIDINAKVVNLNLLGESYISDSFVDMYSFAFFGRKRFFADEPNRAYVTETDNLLKKHIDGIYVNQAAVYPRRFRTSDSTSIAVYLGSANQTIYFGLAFGLPSSVGAIAVLNDSEGLTFASSLDYETGYTLKTRDGSIYTKKTTFKENSLIFFNSRLSTFDNRSPYLSVVSQEADHDNYYIYNAVTKFNGMEVNPTKNYKSSLLNGKKVALIGDSITEYNYRAATNWAMYIADWTSAIVQNLGKSGTGFKHSSNPYINRIRNIDSDTDIIGVAMSFNDMSLTIGTVNDTAESDTVAGNANAFFDALIAAFPTTPIICYCQGPWEAYHYGIPSSDNWVSILEQICANHGVPFYGGLYKGTALRPWILANRELYFTSDNNDRGNTGVVDSVHPNSEGHKIIARYLYPKFVENLCAVGLDYNI